MILARRRSMPQGVLAWALALLFAASATDASRPSAWADVSGHQTAAPGQRWSGSLSTNPADSPEHVAHLLAPASTDSSLPPAWGANPTRVHVIVFSDFQCPVSRRSADATQQIAEEFPGEVRLEFWQHPLRSHPYAESAAVAALAAHRQGKFWLYHDELFRNQGTLDEDSLVSYAGRVGLDLSQFRTDYADPALWERARREGAFAEELGAEDTPAFMINGRLHVGWSSWYAFRTRVARELAAARELEEQGTVTENVVGERAQANITDASQLQRYRDLVLDPLAEAAE